MASLKPPLLPELPVHFRPDRHSFRFIIIGVSSSTCASRCIQHTCYSLQSCFPVYLNRSATWPKDLPSTVGVLLPDTQLIEYTALSSMRLLSLGITNLHVHFEAYLLSGNSFENLQKILLTSSYGSAFQQP